MRSSGHSVTLLSTATFATKRKRSRLENMLLRCKRPVTQPMKSFRKMIVGNDFVCYTLGIAINDKKGGADRGI